MEYLEHEEIEAILGAVDRGTADGRRDYALLATMFNTGARVGEIVALCVADLRLDAPAQVHLHGKGRKQRVCPLWPQTADLLRALLAERERELQSDEPVFRNHRGMRLTRFGVRYLLQKYCTRAQATVPTLRTKRLHPHSMRHSTAVHLLRAGVDIVTISQWLGHASVTTTAPLRHRRSRHEAAGAREGPPHHPCHRGAGPVAHGLVGARVARSTLRKRSVMWSPATFVPWKRLPSSPQLHITDHSTLIDDQERGPVVVP